MTVRFADKEMKDLYEEMTLITRSNTNSIIGKQIIDIPKEGEASSSTIIVHTKFKIPNEATLKAVQESDEGKVIICKDEEDFFKQLKS